MPVPYVPQVSSNWFYIPRTMASDFDNFLDNDIPNTVMDFELLHNWYDREETGYTPLYIRGEIYPDSTKSRYENTDNIMNIRCSITSGIQKGDIIVEPDETIYLLDWEVHLQANNAPSRALRCNFMLEVKRWFEEEVDEDGFAKGNGEESGWRTVVPPIPANAYRYDGRPESVAVSGTPGAIDNALTLLSVQYNEITAKIRDDDIFEWGNETYRIIDVNRVGIHMNGKHGTLKLQAKKQEGGLHGYE